MRTISVLCFTVLLISFASSKNYYVFKIQKLNWHAAFQDCLSRNMQLATVVSSSEQKDLETAINSAGVAHEWLWTSGTDQGEEGNFIWMTTAQHFNYSKWSGGQPDNAGGAENCVHTWKQQDQITWNDWHCANKLYYICEDRPTPCPDINIRFSD